MTALERQPAFQPAGNILLKARNVFSNRFATIAAFFNEHGTGRTFDIGVTVVVHLVATLVGALTRLVTFRKGSPALNRRINYCRAAIAMQFVKRNIRAASTIATVADVFTCVAAARQLLATNARANVRVWTRWRQTIGATNSLTRVARARQLLFARSVASSGVGRSGVGATRNGKVVRPPATARDRQLNVARRTATRVTFGATRVATRKNRPTNRLASRNRVETTFATSRIDLLFSARTR